MRFVALRYFLETARLGSIRRAAEVLHVAPSALSRQIGLLEEDFGAALFERVGGGMRLTAAGELFVDHARTTLNGFDRLRSDLDDVQQLRRGTVRIGSIEGAVPWLLLPALRAFSEEHPGVGFDVRLGGGTELQAAGLVRHELDLMVLFNPEPHPDLLIECAFDNPVCAVVQPDHRLVRRKSVRLADLAGKRLILPSEAGLLRILFDRAAAGEHVTLPAAITINHAAYTIWLGRHGMAIAICPRRAAADEVAAGRLVAIPIDNALLEQTRTVLCRHRTRPLNRAAEAFLIAIKDQAQRLD